MTPESVSVGVLVPSYELAAIWKCKKCDTLMVISFTERVLMLQVMALEKAEANPAAEQAKPKRKKASSSQSARHKSKIAFDPNHPYDRKLLIALRIDPDK